MGGPDDLLSAATPAEAAAGAIAGLCEHVIMFPFDTVRTRMQEFPERHATMRHTFVSMWRTERHTHFYRGCVPVATAAMPAHAAYFSLYESAKRWFGREESSVTHALSACVATTAHDAVSVPFDVVKQRMQADGKHSFASSVACARTVFRASGIRAFFASLPTTVVMNVPHVTVQWVVYERMKQWLALNGDEQLTVDFVTAGFVAGACAASASQPLDVVKTQLQLGKAASMVDAIRFVHSTAGARGFYTGLLPRVCYVAPSSAIVMTSYEALKSVFGVSTKSAAAPGSSM